MFFRDRSCISESSLADNPYLRTVTANGNESRATGPGRLFAYSSVRFPLASGNDQYPVPECGRCKGKDDLQQKLVRKEADAQRAS